MPLSSWAPVWLGRQAFSYCVRSFRQTDSRKADGGNRAQVTSLQTSLWSWTSIPSHAPVSGPRKGCLGAGSDWMGEDPPQSRGQAHGWVEAKLPHKGPLWLHGLALGSASPSGSRKMLPVWQLLERSVLGQGTSPTAGLSNPVGILDSGSFRALGSSSHFTAGVPEAQGVWTQVRTALQDQNQDQNPGL